MIQQRTISPLKWSEMVIYEYMSNSGKLRLTNRLSSSGRPKKFKLLVGQRWTIYTQQKNVRIFFTVLANCHNGRAKKKV